MINISINQGTMEELMNEGTTLRKVESLQGNRKRAERAVMRKEGRTQVLILKVVAVCFKRRE